MNLSFPPDARWGLAPYALAYAERRGWPVFPCGPDHRPLTKHGYKDATHDVRQIERLWKRNPGAMIAMPTGPASGVFVVDLEGLSKGHGDGIQQWDDLQQHYGPAPPTLSARTPSGGRHLYFRYVKGVRTVPLRKLGSAIEIKGDGGSITLAPSRRADGKVYEWENPNAEVAEAPPWLIDLLLKATARKPDTSSTSGSAPPFIDDADLGRGTSSDPADVFRPPSVDEIKAALNVIDPDIDRSRWIKIGFALYSELKQDGYALWDDWSSRGRKYDPADIPRQWESIVAGNGYSHSIRTLFHFADEADRSWRSGHRETATDADGRDDGERQEERKPKSGTRLIKTSGEFVGGFVPPDYLIDGMLEGGNLYALTAPTGDGKTAVAMRIAYHVATGEKLLALEVEKGQVLYLVGENANDVRKRWIKMCEEAGLDPACVDVCFLDANEKLSLDSVREKIRSETRDLGPFALAVIDTSAAYFEGDDENDNVDAGKHARMLRSYIETIDGAPAIIVLCHPTKNPDPNNLLPRGGGAFVAEVDGNLVLKYNRSTMTAEMHWHGKFRGDFSPIAFQLASGTSEKLRDSKGRPIWTVTARPLSSAEKESIDTRADAKADHLLLLIADHPHLSMTEIGTRLGWFYKNGEPNKSLVERTLNKLVAQKLIERHGPILKLTAHGKEAVSYARERSQKL